jgi:GNAT superfamily N-acetyltransferase
MFEMLRASAVEQGFPNSLAVTEADLLEGGFGPCPRFHCAIAEPLAAALTGASARGAGRAVSGGQERTPAGMALYYFVYSSWVSRIGLYLEDLYVDPKFRRAGVARELLHHLESIAKQEGCGRMQWLVHRANANAIRLYESCGAKKLDEWIMMSRRMPDRDRV